jgi:hypothetical protein
MNSRNTSFSNSLSFISRSSAACLKARTNSGGIRNCRGTNSAEGTTPRWRMTLWVRGLCRYANRIKQRSRAPWRPILLEACSSFSTSSGVRYSLERLDALDTRRGGIAEWGAARDRGANPKFVKFVTEFPTTVTGKIQKFQIRAAMIHELGLKQP